MTRIAVEPTRPLSQLDRNIFSGFIEYLGRCIYGGIYNEASALADERGFRKDVLRLLRTLRVNVPRRSRLVLPCVPPAARQRCSSAPDPRQNGQSACRHARDLRSFQSRVFGVPRGLGARRAGPVKHAP